MESKAVGFCAVVAVLGIIAAAAGFAGEITRVKVTINKTQPTLNYLAFYILYVLFF